MDGINADEEDADPVVRRKIQIMKLCKLHFITFIGVITGGCNSPDTPPNDRSPFQSIVFRDGTIIATLPATPRWLIRVGTAESELSKPEESFTLLAGAVIRLSERHSSYKVTAQIVPTAGVTIESTFDARSFGKSVTKRKFFVAAR
jgi:hypothetical protein